MNEIAMLRETLGILDKGRYEKDGKTVALKISREEMC